MATIIKRGTSFLYAFLYVYIIYSLSVGLLKVGLEGASRDIFFPTLSIYLCIPIIKYVKSKGEVVKKSIVENYRINREIEKIGYKAFIMEGVIFKIKNKDFKIENIVVTNKGVFNIVKCNYKGDLQVKKNNRWYQIGRKGESEVISPITEVRKNRSFLAKIVGEEYIVDLVVMVNDGVFVEGEENSDVFVIRYDELYNFISEYPSEEEINESETYDKIYEKMIKINDIREEKILYDNFIDNIWTFRSRLIFITVFFIVYILNVAYITSLH